EEAPKIEPSGTSRPQQLVLLSAKSSSALDVATSNLAGCLERAVGQVKQVGQVGDYLADVAYTLKVGRRAFNHRRMLVCRGLEDATEALQAREAKRLLTRVVERENPPVVFMFPGQGAQHVNMGRELYETEPVFREQIDLCAELLKQELRTDL